LKRGDANKLLTSKYSIALQSYTRRTILQLLDSDIINSSIAAIMASMSTITTLAESDDSSRPEISGTIKATGVAAPSAAISLVSMNEYKEAAACLAEAFRNDHVVRYVVDTPDMEGYSEGHKYKLHTKVFEYLVALYVMKGLAITIGEDYSSVALVFVTSKPPVLFSSLTSFADFLLAVTQMAGGPLSGRASGVSTINSRAKVDIAGSRNSTLFCSRPRPRSWASTMTTRITSPTLGLSGLLRAKDTEGGWSRA
jgi:hypothetical protein